MFIIIPSQPPTVRTIVAAGTPGDPGRGGRQGTCPALGSWEDRPPAAYKPRGPLGTPAAQRGATHRPPMPREGRVTFFRTAHSPFVTSWRVCPKGRGTRTRTRHVRGSRA
eukprot:6648189-Pyramimonas_sp.AAC.2